jgi:hypothetical protein
MAKTEKARSRLIEIEINDENELTVWKVNAKGQELVRISPQVEAARPLLDRASRLSAELLGLYAELGITEPVAFAGFDEDRGVMRFERLEEPGAPSLRALMGGRGRNGAPAAPAPAAEPPAPPAVDQPAGAPESQPPAEPPPAPEAGG